MKSHVLFPANFLTSIYIPLLYATMGGGVLKTLVIPDILRRFVPPPAAIAHVLLGQRPSVANSG